MTVTPTTSSGGMSWKFGGSACEPGAPLVDTRAARQRGTGTAATSRLLPSSKCQLCFAAVQAQGARVPSNLTWNTNLYWPGATGPTNTVSSTWSYFSDSAEPT